MISFIFMSELQLFFSGTSVRSFLFLQYFSADWIYSIAAFYYRFDSWNRYQCALFLEIWN